VAITKMIQFNKLTIFRKQKTVSVQLSWNCYVASSTELEWQCCPFTANNYPGDPLNTENSCSWNSQYFDASI